MSLSNIYRFAGTIPPTYFLEELAMFSYCSFGTTEIPICYSRLKNKNVTKTAKGTIDNPRKNDIRAVKIESFLKQHGIGCNHMYQNKLWKWIWLIPLNNVMVIRTRTIEYCNQMFRYLDLTFGSKLRQTLTRTGKSAISIRYFTGNIFF